MFFHQPSQSRLSFRTIWESSPFSHGFIAFLSVQQEFEIKTTLLNKGHYGYSLYCSLRFSCLLLVHCWTPPVFQLLSPAMIPLSIWRSSSSGHVVRIILGKIWKICPRGQKVLTLYLFLELYLFFFSTWTHTQLVIKNKIQPEKKTHVISVCSLPQNIASCWNYLITVHLKWLERGKWLETRCY